MAIPATYEERIRADAKEEALAIVRWLERRLWIHGHRVSCSEVGEISDQLDRLRAKIEEATQQ